MPKRPEITRLSAIDENEEITPHTVKALGKISGKDGRSLVADLIWLRENESRDLLTKQLGHKLSFSGRNVPISNSLSLVHDRLNIDKTVYSDSDETPKQSQSPVCRPLPDDDDVRSLGSFTKPIPNKSKDVEHTRQQKVSSFQRLRNEIQL